MSDSINKYKDLMNKPKPQESVYDELIPDPNANVKASTDVNLANIPVAKPKKSIRETHKTKAFYIRNDLAKLIDQDIKRGKRGDMTIIANALFEEYYRSQGRLRTKEDA